MLFRAIKRLVETPEPLPEEATKDETIENDTYLMAEETPETFVELARLIEIMPANFRFPALKTVDLNKMTRHVIMESEVDAGLCMPDAIVLSEDGAVVPNKNIHRSIL